MLPGRPRDVSEPDTVDACWRLLREDAELALHGALYAWAAMRFASGPALDLGCEYGFGTALLAFANPSLQVLAVDADRQALAIAARLHRGLPAGFLQADACALPLGSGSLSGICLFNVLHLTPQPELVLLECRRVVRVGAPLILSLPRSGCETGQVERLLGMAREVLGHIDLPQTIAVAAPFLPCGAFDLRRRALVLAECRRS